MSQMIYQQDLTLSLSEILHRLGYTTRPSNSNREDIIYSDHREEIISSDGDVVFEGCARDAWVWLHDLTEDAFDDLRI
jgi:hypothetical protein